MKHVMRDISRIRSIVALASFHTLAIESFHVTSQIMCLTVMTVSLSVYARSCPPCVGDKWKLDWYVTQRSQKRDLLGTYAFSV